MKHVSDESVLFSCVIVCSVTFSLSHQLTSHPTLPPTSPLNPSGFSPTSTAVSSCSVTDSTNTEVTTTDIINCSNQTGGFIKLMHVCVNYNMYMCLYVTSLPPSLPPSLSSSELAPPNNSTQVLSYASDPHQKSGPQPRLFVSITPPKRVK